jgi:hypothetical protein
MGSTGEIICILMLIKAGGGVWRMMGRQWRARGFGGLVGQGGGGGVVSNGRGSRRREERRRRWAGVMARVVMRGR